MTHKCLMKYDDTTGHTTIYSSYSGAELFCGHVKDIAAAHNISNACRKAEKDAIESMLQNVANTIREYKI